MRDSTNVSLQLKATLKAKDVIEREGGQDNKTSKGKVELQRLSNWDPMNQRTNAAMCKH